MNNSGISLTTNFKINRLPIYGFFNPTYFKLQEYYLFHYERRSSLLNKKY